MIGNRTALTSGDGVEKRYTYTKKTYLLSQTRILTVVFVLTKVRWVDLFLLAYRC